ncbi:MAG: hypothetical protein V3T86_03100 [Planctomycetota bacterium]
MFREGLRPPDPFREQPVLERAHSQDGMSLQSLSELSPVLAVCLPALSSKACGRMLTDLSSARSAIETAGARLALVHMGDDAEAAAAFAPHDLQYVARVSDPACELYRLFELGEAAKRRWLVRRAEPQQLPGAVVLSDGEVRAAIRPEAFGEALDYVSLLS